MNQVSRVRKPIVHFALSLLGYVLRGGFSWPGGHLPPHGHVVSRTMAGVGVAASADVAADDWMIACLHNAGIRNVRVDFTYADDQGPCGRLLERLLAADFQVMLHLVQPFEFARKMESGEAADGWQAFVAATLARYGSRVQMVEVGSTINRKRWAGYSLPGFLSMWEIAWREVRARGLVLAGPSVTDFEPPWSVGILALLRRQGMLPDIHTDNLFSERCTEPERFDHKIFGRRLASLAKVNLIKKARLLQRIGQDFDLPRLFSPAAFWTLPRIERMLPDSEEKQADYLTRYMVLCAASGALEGAWWGPLVCHREGLVDDAVPGYPVLERITHYAAVTGKLEDFRIRPALHALSAFNRLIPGATYEGRLNRGQGLEVHAFRSAGQLVHVAWTINGRATALADVYSVDDCRAASFLSRDGEALDEQPTLLCEAPIFIIWPADCVVHINPQVSLAAGLVVHRHAPKRKHFFFRDEKWQGVVSAENLADASLLWREIHPERLAPQSREALLRHARNAIWTIVDPRNGIDRLVVKQPVKMHIHKRFLDRFKPSKALRSWSGTSELLRRGVSAAAPVAYFERIGDVSLCQNFYVSEHLATEFSARDLVAALNDGGTEFLGVGKAEACQQLASFLLLMHGKGICFRDLSGGNILIKPPAADGKLSFSLIDTGRLRAFNHPLPLAGRLSDLVRICNKMDPPGRAQFLEIYLSGIGHKLTWSDRIPFWVYDWKVVLKRRIGRKAIKRLMR
jgi:hypothetical protein